MSEALGQGEESLNRDPLAPVTHGLEFIADHEWPRPTPKGNIDPDVLRRLIDQVVIVNDLPERGEMNPELRGSLDPYTLPAQFPGQAR